LGDQVQDMLARTLKDSTAAADPLNSNKVTSFAQRKRVIF
jgi:hypothetical protein